MWFMESFMCPVRKLYIHTELCSRSTETSVSDHWFLDHWWWTRWPSQCHRASTSRPPRYCLGEESLYKFPCVLFLLFDSWALIDVIAKNTAGVTLAPNLSKIMYHWGLRQEMQSIAVNSQAINLVLCEHDRHYCLKYWFIVVHVDRRYWWTPRDTCVGGRDVTGDEGRLSLRSRKLSLAPSLRRFVFAYGERVVCGLP